MKIVFFDSGPLDYTVITPLQRPLGGMQSAVCYLAIELAKRGHQVVLTNGTSEPKIYDGVECVSFPPIRADLKTFDIAVCIDSVGAALRHDGVTCPMILWTGHDIDQPAVANLSNSLERNAWSKYVFVSNWQATRYRSRFGIEHDRIATISNAIAPAFEDLKRDKKYFFEEGRPPVLQYSSTPFRGLDVLVEAFPLIREKCPGATARIFSSMKVYQAAEEDIFEQLYERCRKTVGMEYHGSVNQQQLAEALSDTDIFAYPSTFPETSCIALMEAMASGCLIVAHNLGALAETANGFGSFLDMDERQPIAERAKRYASFVVDAVNSSIQSAHEVRDKLNAQQEFAQKNYRYSTVADKWEAVLYDLISRKNVIAPGRRNAPCPCGSGKKYKHCHGRDVSTN